MQECTFHAISARVAPSDIYGTTRADMPCDKDFTMYNSLVLTYM
jgi:hypothetical protein